MRAMSHKKRLFYLYCLLFGFPLWSEGVAANSDFLRTLNRSATIDSIDSALFNPAGTVKLTNGTYIHVGNQFGIHSRITEQNGNQIPDISFSFINPDFIFLHKESGYSFFATVHSPNYYNISQSNMNFTPSGGGNTIYGDAALDRRWTELTFGGAFALFDFLSAGFGIRLVNFIGLDRYSFYELSGSDLVAESYTDAAYGFGVGGIGSLLITPARWLALSVNFKTEVSAIVSHKIISVTNATGTPPSETLKLASQNSKSFNMSPAELAVGVNIYPIPALSLQTQFTLIFDKKREYVPGTAEYIYSGNKPSMRVGAGADWQITRTIKWGAGISYNLHYNNSLMYNSVSNAMPELDSFEIGTGVAVKFGNVELKPSLMMPIYLNNTQNGTKYSAIDAFLNISATIYIDLFNRS
jgi:hypothetical protein